MTLPEEIDHERNKTERALHKSELDRQLGDLGQEINRAGHAISEEIRKCPEPRSPRDGD